MFCPNCGTENRDDAIFCNLCQEPLQRYTQESMPESTPASQATLATSSNVWQPGMAPSPATPGFTAAGGPSPIYPPYPGPYPGPSPYAPGPSYPSYPVMVAQKTPGEATASLVLGIVGLFVCPIICSLLAIIFGIKARNMIDASGGYLGGRSQAQAGLVLGIVGMAIGTLGTIIYIIALAAAGSSSSVIPLMGML